MELRGLSILLLCVGTVVCSANNVSDSGGSPVLKRKKRFMLFTPGSHLLITAAFGKGVVFSGPAGYVAIGELDLYYPLPDYNYQASALRLGGVAMYPPEKKKKPPPPPPSPPPPPPMPMPVPEAHDHHAGGELTPDEVQHYLKDHPDAWVPPGWGKERADWNEEHLQYGSRYWTQERVDQPQYQYPTSPTLSRYLGGFGAGGDTNGEAYGGPGWSEAPGARYRRSTLERPLDADREEEHERAKWLSGEAFNISQHRDWEHFHHYRDRRALFSQLEEAIGSVTGMHMKDCILRSICEAKNILPPPGRSMTMDIFRVLFSFPLNEALDDDYSNARREDNVDCHERYGRGCPMSLLDLVLFGKFEP